MSVKKTAARAAGTAALMSDEVLIGKAGYEWTLNHIIAAASPEELFRTRFHEIAPAGAKETV